MNNPSLSVKCSSNTRNNLKRLFAKHSYFIDLQNNNVNINVSWFFKHSANIFLSSLDNYIPKIQITPLDYENAFYDQFAVQLDKEINFLLTKL